MKRFAFIMVALFGLRLAAQQNAVHQYPSVYYQRGLELFDEKKFNAAIIQFNLFIEKSDNDGQKSEAEYYLAISKLYAEHRDGEAAVKRFLEQNPGSHKTHMANLALGDYYYLKRKYSSALTYYKQVDLMAISPTERDRFLFRKGYTQLERKKYKDAAETLRPLTEKENDYKVLATYYYAYCAYYSGDYKEALRAFKAVEEDGPKMVRLYVAQIYYMQGEYDKAIAYLDKSSTGIPKSQVYLVKGKCYYRLNKFDQAAENFNKSGLTRDSLDKNEVYEFAYANYRIANYSKAVDWFKLISFQGDSMSQYASYNLGDAYLKLKSKREAMNAFAEAYRTSLNKNVAEDALFNQAKLAVELKEPNAASLLQKYVDNYPKSKNATEAKKLLAKLMLNTDNYKDAVAVLESIGELDEQTEESYQRVTLARGMELFKSRQWNDAAAMFDKCMAKKVNRKVGAQAAFWKGECMMQQGKYADAKVNYEKFMDVEGNEGVDYYPYVFYGMGYVHYKAEEWANAIQFFEKYIQTSTRGSYNEKVYGDAQLRIGDCSFARAGSGIPEGEKQKSLDKAVKAYAYVTGKRSTDADYAQFQTGLIYGLIGQPEKKISAMKRLVADYPNSRFIADAYFELGSEYLNLKPANTREAEKYFMYVIDDFKGNPLVGKSYAVLGRMYYNANQDNKAIDMYTKLVDEYPGSSEAKAATDQVKRIYMEQGRVAEYEKWIQRRGGISTSSADTLYFESAVTVYEKSDYRGAAQAFTEYLTRMPNGVFVVDAHYYRAYCYETLKDKDKAIADYKVVADASGSQFQEDAVINLLKLYGPNAPCEDMVPYLDKIEKLTKVRETRYKAWTELLHCYTKLNRISEGREVARKISDELSAPEDLKAEALVYLGVADFAEKKYRSALDRFAEAYSRYNNQHAAEAKYREAVVYLAIDSTEACKNSCYGVLDQFGSYDYWVGKSMLLLGDAFLAENDEVDAKASWNSVIDNFDTPELVNEAREKLAKLKNRSVKTNNVNGD